MREFDPAIFQAPDLVVEIDITRRSIKRLPIYALLGVPEIRRVDGYPADRTWPPEKRPPPGIPISPTKDQMAVQLDFEVWIQMLPH